MTSPILTQGIGFGGTAFVPTLGFTPGPAAIVGTGALVCRGLDYDYTQEREPDYAYTVEHEPNEGSAC